MSIIRYSLDHEYVRQGSAGIAIIGISAWASNMLGAIMSVQLSTVGTIIKAGETIAILESTKAVSEVFAPLSGEIITVNPLVLEHPEFINEDPLNKGWLCQLTRINATELTQLLDEDSYAQYCTNFTALR